jgi:hypothetical protein
MAMIGRTALWACLAVAIGGGAVPAPAADGPVYAITRVSSSLTDDDLVGSKRAGLVCLPNGAIRWRDVGTGGSMDQREVVQDALEDTGLAVTPLGFSSNGSAAHPVLHLRATVKAAAFRLCAKHYLGDARALSGDAALELEWRVEALDGSEVSHVSKISRHIDESHAASLAGIYRQLLSDAAVDAAGWLRTSPH